jgi:hypothetical protein
MCLNYLVDIKLARSYIYIYVRARKSCDPLLLKSITHIRSLTVNTIVFLRYSKPGSLAAGLSQSTDGSKLRDSEAVKSKRGPKQLGTIGRSKPKRAAAKPRGRASAALAHSVRGKRASKGGRWGRDPHWCTIPSSSTSKKLQMAKAHIAFEASFDLSFLDSWREDRAQSLKPSCGPSASSRMDALRQRVAAKIAASSS